MKRVTYTPKKEKYRFNVSMLKIGEMMLVNDNDIPNVQGHILLRTYDSIVSLDEPNRTFNTFVHITGTKLEPGDTVLLEA